MFVVLSQFESTSGTLSRRCVHATIALSHKLLALTEQSTQRVFPPAHRGALPMNFPRISLSTAADGTLYFYKYVSFSSDLLYLIIREIVGRSSGSMAPIDFFKPSYMVQCLPRWCYRDHKTACSNPAMTVADFLLSPRLRRQLK